uniref:Zinc finger protein Xfin n=1 Tax=Cacopsylla melanoneura TaxID=428564 RepID=A0A8D8VJ71_9HEMI
MASYMRSFNFLYNTNTGEVEINPNYFDNAASAGVPPGGVPQQHYPHQNMVHNHAVHPPHLPPLSVSMEHQPYLLQELQPQHQLIVKPTHSAHLLITPDMPEPVPMAPPTSRKGQSQRSNVSDQPTVPQAPPPKVKPTKDRPFECKTCFRKFNQKQTLKQHILTHTGQRPFECNICFKTFTQQGALQRHMVIHTGEKPFPCTVCDMSFRQKVSLVSHLKLHQGAPKEYKCSVCRKEFTRKGHLSRHMVIHNNERPKLKCSCCDKEFLNKESLQRHEKNQELREKGMQVPNRNKVKVGRTVKSVLTCKECCRTFRRVKTILCITHELFNEYCTLCAPSHYEGTEKLSTGIIKEVEIFECPDCKVTFYKESSYERHKLLHSEDRPFQCDICKLRFSTKTFLKTHITKHFDIYKYQCHMCGLKFKYSFKLKTHYIKHVNEFSAHDLSDYVKTFECHFCTGVFYQRQKIINHLRKHEEEFTRKAEEERELAEKAKVEATLQHDDDGYEDYESHMDYDDWEVGQGQRENETKSNRAPDVDRPFSCYVCKRAYTKKRSLSRHFKVQHTNYEKFTCEICSKEFQTKNSLKQHYVLHKPHSFQCKHCDKTFNRKDALQSHVLIHSNKKDFQCTMCDKSFFQKQSLHSHMAQHKGEKPFECGVCLKRFYEKSTLNRHYLSHSGERRYTCEICLMSFTQKNVLNQHYLRHDEIEKKVKFECSTCGKVFYRKDHYFRHLKSHETNRDKLPCEKCDRLFSDKYSLSRHVRLNRCSMKSKDDNERNEDSSDEFEEELEEEVKENKRQRKSRKKEKKETSTTKSAGKAKKKLDKKKKINKKKKKAGSKKRSNGKYVDVTEQSEDGLSESDYDEERKYQLPEEIDVKPVISEIIEIEENEIPLSKSIKSEGE